MWPTGICKVAIVGEAPNAEEVIQGKPFVGPTGKMLHDWLKIAGIDRADCLLTNVFGFKAPGNDVSKYFIRKREAKQQGYTTPEHPMHPEWGWVGPEWVNELARLKQELEQVDPNVVVVLGGTALWALLGDPKIGKARGTTAYARDYYNNIKIVPTFHPSAIIRNYSNQPLAIMDIIKAKAESNSKDIKRIEREFWLEPTVSDIVKFKELYIDNSTEPVAFDIETSDAGITCIGFAPTKDKAIVIPFYSEGMPNGNYWTLAEELVVWKLVAEILEDPKIIKVAQNGIYDTMWLSLKAGIEVRGMYHDTMHMHHALQPEMPKGLGVLGSLYTNEASWKHMVSHSKLGNKRDDN